MATSSRLLCLAFLFTVAAVQAGVLPEVPDQKGAAGSSLGNHVPTAEEQSSFMDRFLSKVTSSSGKPEDKPEPAVLEHDEEDEEEPAVESRHGGSRHGRRRHKKHRGGDHRHHGDRHHHHDDHYDHHDDHDDGGHYLDGSYEEDVFAKASVDCRFDVYPYAANPEECSKVSLKNFKPDLIFDNPHKEHSGGGACFWDFQLAKLEGGTNACLCPRKKKECHQKKQCYWFKHRVPGDKHKDSKGHNHHDGKDSKDKDEKELGVCMHNSERFYNLMARLLAKRGKKDLSLKIQYSSAPARGKLPWGPKGPAIIGYGEELGKYLDKIYPDKNPWNYQFQEGFDPYLWLGYKHPDPNHHKGGRKGHKGGRHFGKGGHHHYGGYGHGDLWYGHFGGGDHYGYGKSRHGSHDFDDHHEDDYYHDDDDHHKGHDDHHEDDYYHDDHKGHHGGSKGGHHDYYGYEDPYGPFGRYGYKRYHHYGPHYGGYGYGGRGYGGYGRHGYGGYGGLGYGGYGAGYGFGGTLPFLPFQQQFAHVPGTQQQQGATPATQQPFPQPQQPPQPTPDNLGVQDPSCPLCTVTREPQYYGGYLREPQYYGYLREPNSLFSGGATPVTPEQAFGYEPQLPTVTSQPGYTTPFPRGATVTTPQGGVTPGQNAFGYEQQLPTVTPQPAYHIPFPGGATVTPPQVAQYPVQPATTQGQYPNAAVPGYTAPPPEPEYQEPTEFPGYPAPPVYPNPQDPEYLAPASAEVEASSPFPGLPQLPEQDSMMREQEAMENFYREFGNIFPEAES